LHVVHGANVPCVPLLPARRVGIVHRNCWIPPHVWQPVEQPASSSIRREPDHYASGIAVRSDPAHAGCYFLTDVLPSPAIQLTDFGLNPGPSQGE